MKHVVLALLLLGSIRVWAAGDCEARLVADWVYGAVKAMVKLGAVGPKELRAMLNSPVPINPLEKATPTVKNGHAQEILSDIAKDPKVRLHWAATQARIRTLVNEGEKAEGEGQRAAERTQLVLKPVLERDIEDSSGRPSFAQLANGEILLAYFARYDLLRVIRFRDGDEVLSQQLDRPANLSWVLSWHRESDGGLVLYATGQVLEETGLGQAIYKFRPGDKQLTRLDYKLGHKSEIPLRLTDLGPGFLMLETTKERSQLSAQHYYNLASDNLSVETENIKSPRDIRTLPPGKVFQVAGSMALSAPSGRAFSIGAGPSQNKLIVQEAGKTGFTEYDLPLASRLSWKLGSLFESKAGEIYLAVVQENSGAGDALVVVKIGGGPKPVLTYVTQDSWQPDLLKFFFNPRGEVNLAYGRAAGLVNSNLLIFDLDSQSEPIELHMRGHVDGWFEMENQVYISTFDKLSQLGPSSIYKLFSPSRDGGPP